MDLFSCTGGSAGGPPDYSNTCYCDPLGILLEQETQFELCGLNATYGFYSRIHSTYCDASVCGKFLADYYAVAMEIQRQCPRTGVDLQCQCPVYNPLFGRLQSVQNCSGDLTYVLPALDNMQARCVCVPIQTDFIQQNNSLLGACSDRDCLCNQSKYLKSYMDEQYMDNTSCLGSWWRTWYEQDQRACTDCPSLFSWLDDYHDRFSCQEYYYGPSGDPCYCPTTLSLIGRADETCDDPSADWELDNLMQENATYCHQEVQMKSVEDRTTVQSIHAVASVESDKPQRSDASVMTLSATRQGWFWVPFGLVVSTCVTWWACEGRLSVQSSFRQDTGSRTGSRTEMIVRSGDIGVGL